jgi:hypothetical protein
MVEASLQPYPVIAVSNSSQMTETWLFNLDLPLSITFVSIKFIKLN